MKSIPLLSIALALALGGCKSGSGGAHTHTPPPPPPPQAIEMAEFAVVDSYGTDSELDPNMPLALNPYRYDGLFEVYWDVNVGRDYDFFLSVSDTPSIDNSMLVYSEYCGAGLVCDRQGYAVCQYTSDFTLGCADQPAVDVYSLFYEVPQTLYVFAEACDRGTCSYQRRVVTME